jgi:branched-chain amino acid aminotransferase
MSVEPLVYHNGRFIPRSELKIGFHDAGFVFGATVTDFCRTYRHQLFRWPDHLARFRNDCNNCFIPLPSTDAELTQAAKHLVSINSEAISANDDLALILFATPGPLGYMMDEPGSGPPTIAMHTFRLPIQRYQQFFTAGVTLQLAGELPTWGSFANLAHAKHRSRLHWWCAQNLQTTKAVPVLNCPRTFAPDTPIGAILAVRGNTVFRANIGETLHSISAFNMVQVLCRQLGLGFEIREKWGAKSGENDLKADSEWILAGTAFGIASIRRYIHHGGEHQFDWPGPVFQKLAAAWSEVVGRNIVQQFTG